MSVSRACTRRDFLGSSALAVGALTASGAFAAPAPAKKKLVLLPGGPSHIACGVKTNVVTAVRILDKHSSDSPQFVPLVNDTAKDFTIGEVSADKAYSSLENFEAVAACGGTAFIAFKYGATGGVGGLFQKMFHYFQFNQEDYMKRYHKRSNVESTFSMIKRKFGDSVRSKTDTAMENEVLCKILCHNICCLIREQQELAIETVFWSKQARRAYKQVALIPQVALATAVEPVELGDDFRFSD